MKRLRTVYLIIFLSAIEYSSANAQELDSLRNAMANAGNDSIRMYTLINLAQYYIELDRDSSLFYTGQALDMSRKLNQPLWTAESLLNKAYVLMHLGDLVSSIRLVNESSEISKNAANEQNFYNPPLEYYLSHSPRSIRLYVLAGASHQLGNLYSSTRNSEKAIKYFQEEIAIAESINSKDLLVTSNMNIGTCYFRLNRVDSAFVYVERVLKNAILTESFSYLGNILEDMGDVYLKQNLPDSAKQYYWQALHTSGKYNNLSAEVSINTKLAGFYHEKAQYDSSIYYADKALRIANALKVGWGISAAAEMLSDIYRKKGNSDSAYAYLLLTKKLKDSLANERIEMLQRFQNIGFEEQLSVEKKERKESLI